MPFSTDASSSLHRKLQLLESRFTEAPSSPATLLPEDNASRSQHSIGFEGSGGAKKPTHPTTPTPAWIKMTEQYIHELESEDPTVLTGHKDAAAPKAAMRSLVQASFSSKENSSPPPKATVS